MAALHKHTRDERLLAAKLSGIVRRHAERGIATEAAVDELHGLTSDPHLLGHAWAHPDPRGFPDPFVDRINELLAAAGAEQQPPNWEKY